VVFVERVLAAATRFELWLSPGRFAVFRGTHHSDIGLRLKALSERRSSYPWFDRYCTELEYFRYALGISTPPRSYNFVLQALIDLVQYSSFCGAFFYFAFMLILIPTLVCYLLRMLVPLLQVC